MYKKDLAGVIYACSYCIYTRGDVVGKFISIPTAFCGGY